MRTAWLSRHAGAISCSRCCASARSARSCGRERPDRLPASTAHLARAASSWSSAARPGSPPRGRRLDELAPICERDHGGGPPDRGRRAHHLTASRSPGAAARVLDPPTRPRRRATAATLERRAARFLAVLANAERRETILVTGGGGFIGSNFVRYLLERQRFRGREPRRAHLCRQSGNLADVADDERYRFVHGSICDADAVARAAEGCDAIVNFAAETHVDRSIMEAGDFIQTDVFGTYLLLSGSATRADASCTSPPTRSTATSSPATPRARTTRCGRARPTRPPRPAATCRCSPPCAPTASTRSSRAARTTTGPTSTRRS